MGAADPSVTHGDLTKNSDKELILAYCAVSAPREQNRPAQEIANILWNRHGQSVVYRELTRLVRTQPSLCPGYNAEDPRDRQLAMRTILDSSFTEAYLNFTRRLCGFDVEGSFFEKRFCAWLKKVAQTALLDYRRKIVGRPPKDGAKTTNEANASATQPGGTQTSSGEQETPNPPTRHFVEFDEELESGVPPSVLAKIGEQERKSIVRSLMKEHAGSSEEGAESAYTIGLRLWHEWSVPRLAVYFFGESADAKERKAKEDKIYRRLREDYKELVTLAAKQFRIAALRHV